MATQVILPKLGQTMEEGTIVEWFKSEGDPVSRGDVLYNVESDKAVLEVEARASGVLRKILVGPGTKVPVGTPVAVIGRPDEDIDDLVTGVIRERPLAEEAEPAASTGMVQGEADVTEPPGGRGEVIRDALTEVEHAEAPPQGEIEEQTRIFASPRARRVAAERGVELGEVDGSGPHGRIVERDVLDYLARQPAATPLARREARRLGVPLEQVARAGERVRAEQVREAAERPEAVLPGEAGELRPMSGVRAIIADRMAASAHTTAAVTLQSVVDATELVTLRETLKEAFAEELGFNIGYNDLLGLIVVRCLQEFPYMNVRLEGDGIRQLEGVNLGLAVDSDRGLLVPVVHGADRMGLRELATEIRAVVVRAREGRATPDDLSGGTFTITNLGMFGVDMFTPIINLPECAILGVGRIRPEPVAEGERVVVRQRMWLSLTFDHRLVDGAPAARFLQGIMRYIESPYLLLA